MSFGDMLKKLRIEKGLTQEQLAKELGFSKETIFRYENGRRKPNFKAMAKIEKFFGVSASYLNGETDKNDYEATGSELKETLIMLISKLTHLKEFLEKMPQEEQLEAYTFLDVASSILANKDIREEDFFDYINIINGLLLDLHRFIQFLGKAKNNKAAEIGSVVEKYVRSLSRSISDLVELYGFESSAHIKDSSKETNVSNEFASELDEPPVTAVKEQEAIYIPVFDLRMLDDSIFKINNKKAIDDRITLPIKGDAAAGKPIEIFELDQGNLLVDKKHASYNSFLIRVRGDSMIEAGINDGDYVIVRPQPIVENGEIALVDIDGDATIKYFYKKHNGYELRSANPAYQPMIYDSSEKLKIIGKIVDVIPKNKASDLISCII